MELQYNIKQLENLTMGEIAEKTSKYQNMLQDIKHQNKLNAIKEPSAQDFIDLTNTKIKGDFFQ